jgi:hypothetical protein
VELISEPVAVLGRMIIMLLFTSMLSEGCYAQKESGMFAPAEGSPLATGAYPLDLVLVDLNLDGNADVVTANRDSQDLTVLLGDGKGRFTTHSAHSDKLEMPSHLIASGDFDRDGKTDLVISYHHSYDVTVLFGDGLGGFEEKSTFSVITEERNPPHNHGLAVGDLNADGDLDIITSNHQDNSVSVLLGDGPGNFATAEGSPFEVGRGPYPLALGDVNGDRSLDIMTPNMLGNDISVLLGDGKGKFSPANYSPTSVERRPFYVASADLNGDRNLDLVITYDDAAILTLLFGNGQGGFHKPSSSPVTVEQRGWKVVPADMNQDGQVDLVMGTFGKSVAVLLGDGKGKFQPAYGSPFRVDRAPYSVAVGDVNGDGAMDIATANAEANSVSILLGRPH